MRDTFIKTPFASAGDRTAIPNGAQPDGSISMQQGWGADYTLEVGVDPAAKSVDRGHMNQILNLATALLNRWQTETFPEWIDSVSNGGIPFSYPFGAIVRYSADGSSPYVAWINTIENNSTTPAVINGWVLLSDVLGLVNDPTLIKRGSPFLASNIEALLGSNPSKMMTPANKRFSDQPFFSGNAVLTGVDNKLVMPDVVTSLALEVGDVVEIDGGGATNKKLRTVESISGSNQIVLNYEHCGSRGNGPLKLQDYSGPVTITRIAKWYGASESLGQDWVDVTSLRSYGVNYSGLKNRAIHLRITGSFSQSRHIIVNGVALAQSDMNATAVLTQTLSAEAVSGSTYSYTRFNTTAANILELR